MQNISNVKLSDYRRFLKSQRCTATSITGGHEKWVRKDLLRPITVQTHVDPVPAFIVKTTLRALKLTNEDLFAFLDGD